jgi:membrane protease YdiL (CAAX protease family)
MIVLLTGGVFVSMLGFLGCWIWTGLSFEELSVILTNFEDVANLGYLKLFQVLQSLGMFILPPLVLAYALSNTPFQFLQLNRKPTLILVGLVGVLILVGGPLIEWFSLLNQQLVLPSWLSSLENWMRDSEDQANQITEAFLSTTSIGGLLGNLVIVAVLPAVGEELLFRGLLQNLFKRMTGNHHSAIWITAILFSALHLQFFGFLPRMLLGVLFGYLLEWTGSLWLPIIAHFINNAAGVLLFYFTGEGLEPDQSDAALFNNSLFFWALVSGAIVWLLLRYLYSQRLEEKISD